MADHIDKVKAMMEAMNMSDNLADDCEWTSAMGQSASGKDNVKAMVDGMSAKWKEGGKPEMTDWTAKSADTVSFVIKTTQGFNVAVECTMEGDKIKKWMSTKC